MVSIMIQERKQVAICPFQEQGGCTFRDVNPAFILELSEKIKG